MRYEPNRAAEPEIAAYPGTQAVLRTAAGVARIEIRAAAPHKTGYYRRHLSARGTRVLIGDPFWHLVEFGSVNNPPYAPVRRGIRAAGLTFIDHK